VQVTHCTWARAWVGLWKLQLRLPGWLLLGTGTHPPWARA